jgi:hypothetical protein
MPMDGGLATAFNWSVGAEKGELSLASAIVRPIHNMSCFFLKGNDSKE